MCVFVCVWCVCGVMCVYVSVVCVFVFVCVVCSRSSCALETVKFKAQYYENYLKAINHFSLLTNCNLC